MDTASTSQNKILFYTKRITGAALLLALAATFFYSAYSKSGVKFQGFYLVSDINAFDSFQWTFLDLGINSILAAGIIARMMIGFELLLGIFLVFHIFLRSFTYPAIITILSIFIIYLLIIILKQGNSGNCGCFGDKVAMKPLAAIWKNVAMIAVTILLMYIYPVKPYKYQEFYCMALALVAFSMPFVVNNIDPTTNPEPYSKPIDLGLLYKYTPAPIEELRTGKHLIAFMSLTCPHCKKAAYLLHVIHLEHPDIPMFIVLDGPEAFKQKFFDETHAEDIPNLYYFKHTAEFIQLAGPGVPSIYLVNNGKIEYKGDYYHLDPGFLERWYRKK